MSTTEAPSVQLASTERAAERYDVHPRTIRRHIAEGTITGYRVGRLLKVDLIECDRVFLRPIPTAHRRAVVA